jgi:sugar lactone lactonase YvrE
MAPNGDIFVVELAGAKVSRVTPDGAVTTFAELGGSPNGSAIDPDGHLYVCNGGGRWAAETSTGGINGLGDSNSLIQRVAPDRTATTLISRVGERRLNAPNDICFDPDGRSGSPILHGRTRPAGRLRGHFAGAIWMARSSMVTPASSSRTGLA